ncbi:MAG TPA: cbb3-type cytochrome c oxidase subunit I [Candidatus Acidoferrum sp.]|nr:cbb3-type cytochrome c oxidase subunit I [Candidatus Acidoferrum sp.]
MNEQNEALGRAALLRRQADQQVSPTGPVEQFTSTVDASLRLPLLALFGGAALWLVLGSVLAMIASIKFHAPDFLASCPVLTYGRVQPAADDALLYGFCIPAGLGVILWLFAHLGRAPLRGAVVPLFAAYLWHLGVLVGIGGILLGYSTGFPWLEFPRGSSVLLFFAYLLLALWAAMNFAARRDRGLYPSHWFLVAALFWFPWIYSTGNLFLVAWPVRGVVQSIIGWWFVDNLLFVWLALVGLGTAFYFLPKFSGRPLQTYYLALCAFGMLILFGAWCGIPQGAPVPTWLPTVSTFAALLTLVPVLAVGLILARTLRGREKSAVTGGPFCFVRFGTVSFLLSSLMFLATACPHFSRITEFTWFGPAQSQLQLYGFFAMTMFGAIYFLLPRVMGIEWPFPRLARLQFWLSLIGVALFVIPLAIGGVVQGIKLNNGVAFPDVTKATLVFFRVSTTGLLLLLLASLLFALNILGITFVWKMSLLKSLLAAVKAPLETGSPSAPSPVDQEVKA